MNLALRTPAIQTARKRHDRRNRVMRPLCLSFAIVAISFAVAFAAPDPMAVVKDTVNQVLAAVTNPRYKSGDSAERDKLREVIAPRFDFSDMARSAMGYHWRTLTQGQRDEFVKAFTRLLQASYMGKIEGYKGQEIQYVKEKRDDGYAEVSTRILQPGSKPISVNYRLKSSDETWRVYDVLIDQISLVGNYRSQFSRIMNDKGYDELVSAIKKTEQSVDAGT